MKNLSKSELVTKDIQLKINSEQIYAETILSERKTAEIYKVSRFVARNALSRLTNLGVVKRVPSVGYVVQNKRSDTILNDITDNLRQINIDYRTGSDNECKISHRTFEADKNVASDLHIPLGTKILEITKTIQRTQDNYDDFLLAKYQIPTPMLINKPSQTEYSVKSLPIQPIPKDSLVSVVVSLSSATESECNELALTPEQTVVHTHTTVTNPDGTIICTIKQSRNPEHAAFIKPDLEIYRKLGGYIG